MADAMRAMLDELMGKERNVPLDQRKGTDLRFNDPEVCKYALSGLCPYGLFKNTKSDLGKYGVLDGTCYALGRQCLRYVLHPTWFAGVRCWSCCNLLVGRHSG